MQNISKSDSNQGCEDLLIGCHRQRIS